MSEDSPYARMLVPVDHAGCAWEVVAHAVRLATAFDAKVTLLHVVDPPPHTHAADPSGASTVGATLTAEATRELGAMKAVFPPHLDVAVVVRNGPPAPVILDAVVEHRATLLVMGTHARTGLRRLVHGSVAEEVIRRSPVPVFVVRSGSPVAEGHSAAWEQAAAEGDG